MLYSSVSDEHENINKCFSPDTIIYGEFGIKRIDEISIGDKVLTLDGSFKRVNNIYKTIIDKEILKITTNFSFEDILVSGDHQIYSFNEEEGLPCYVLANDLNNMSMLCFPLQKEIFLNNDNMEKYYKFYGIIFSNGYIYEEENTILIIFKEYKPIISFLEDFLINQKINYTLTGYVFDIKLNDIKIEYYKNIYDNNGYKKLDIEFFNISKRDTVEFLTGIFESSDEYFITDNKILAYQLSYMSLKIDKPRKCTKYNMLYKIESKSNNNLYDMYEYEDDVELNSLFENKIWYCINDIDRIKYNGDVYDLDIDSDNNYTTNLGIVYNYDKNNF
jgi:hypothetical protein